jgi:hypothetical protein
MIVTIVELIASHTDIRVDIGTLIVVENVIPLKGPSRTQKLNLVKRKRVKRDLTRRSLELATIFIAIRLKP